MNENIKVDVTEQIKNEIKSNDVVLFMKGTPTFPMCGFSAAVVQLLTELGIKFSTINVLDVIFLVNFILENESPTTEQFEAADINIDGSLNIQDVIILVNLILN